MNQDARALIEALTPGQQEQLARLARNEVWRRVAEGKGDVTPLLHSGQCTMRETLLASEAAIYYLSVARQFGKSLGLLAIILELMWRTPGSLWHWWAPYRDDAIDIVEQKARILLEGVDDAYAPALNKKDVRYRLSNGSELHFFGANNDRARFSRGRTVHGIVIDEAAEIDDLVSLVDSICLPMLLHSGGSLWLSSTPAKLADHTSYAYVRAALSRGDCFRATIHDNPLLSQAQIDRQCEAAGGEDSPAWRREHLVELDVVDPDAVLVPEWGALKGELVRTWEIPDTYPLLRRYVGVDPGVSDRTGLTYATFDFERQTIRGERARLLKRASTHVIADTLKEDIAELWPGALAKSVTVVVDDAQGRMVLDLADEGVIAEAALKDERDAAIGLLRGYVARKRITLEPNACEVWSRQLEFAHEVKRKLARNAEGHFDCFDAGLYMVRAMDRDKLINPLPTHEQLHGVRRPPSGSNPLLDAFGTGLRSGGR